MFEVQANKVQGGGSMFHIFGSMDIDSNRDGTTVTLLKNITTNPPPTQIRKFDNN